MSSFRDFVLNRDPSAAWALAVAMIGVRMGERALFVGDDGPLFAHLAGKIGLTGHAAVAVASANARAAVEGAAAKAGVLIEDVRVANLPELPLDTAQFDLAVVNVGPTVLALGPDDKARLAANLHRALRTGGRLVVVEGAPARLLGLLKSNPPGLPAFRSAGGAERLLETAGFRPVRLLADRDGQRFTEGLKHHG